jgi:hypothetical protein
MTIDSFYENLMGGIGEKWKRRMGIDVIARWMSFVLFSLQVTKFLEPLKNPV